MNILFISSVFPPDIGGPSLQAASLMGKLPSNEVQIVLAVPQEKNLPPAESRLKVAPIHDAGGGRRGIKAKIARFAGYIRFFKKLIRAERIDLIHVQVFGDPIGLAAMAAGWWRKVPLLVKLTGEKHLEMAGERGTSGWKVRLLRLLDLWQLRSARMVWATSPEFQTRLREEYKVPLERILVLPNFIELKPFLRIFSGRKQHERNSLRVICVARLRPWKGIEHTLRACALAGSAVESITIIGSGDPAYSGSLRALAESLDLGSRAEFLDNVPPTEIAARYGDADVLMLLSDYEPFGIVLIEAMAAGVCVVAASTGGIPSVLGGLGGDCLVPAADPAAAAEKLRVLAGNPSTRKTLALRGKEQAVRFGINAGAAKLIETYRELVAS